MSMLPVVRTLEAAAERLLTTPEKVRAELEAGRLEGFKLGDDEWRTTDAALLKFMGVSPSVSIPQERPDEMTIAATASVLPTVDIAAVLESKTWRAVDPFDYRWPEGIEHYEEAYGTRISLCGRDIPILIGFCNRESAGDPNRRRAVVFMGHQPSLNALVEFSGENSVVFGMTGRMASVIKLPSGKHLKPGDAIPLEYVGLPLANYKSIVRGPYAAASIAVVAHKDDFRLMAHHGLIRARQRKLLRP
jgi:hypothetical protein